MLPLATILVLACRLVVPITPASLAAAVAYSEEHGGRNVLILHRGREVAQRTAPGVSAGTPQALASGTKSFAGVILAAAIEDGLITSFDELVGETIHEWRGDPRRSRITIRQLLSLSSGIEGGGIGRPPSYADAIDTPCVAEPGRRFQYGPAPFQIFGELMRRKLAARGADGSPASVEAYLRERLLEPMGITPGRWSTDRDGNINLPSGAALTARAWARFGEFMRRGGRVGDRQVVRADLIAELTRPSAANGRYGITFWLSTSEADGLDPERALQANRPLRRVLGGAPDPLPTPAAGTLYEHGAAAPTLFMAAGLGKQRCYVIPQLELVIVRQGDLVRRSGFEDRAFLELLIVPEAWSAGMADRGRRADFRPSIESGAIALPHAIPAHAIVDIEAAGGPVDDLFASLKGALADSSPPRMGSPCAATPALACSRPQRERRCEGAGDRMSRSVLAP